MRGRCFLLSVLLPASVLAQAASPAGIQFRQHARMEPCQRTIYASIAQDTAARRPSAAPFVLVGAATGALIGLLIYQSGVEATQDGDFGFPFTLMLPLSAGAIVGAYVGWILRPM